MRTAPTLRKFLCLAFLLVLVPLLAPAQQHGDTSMSRGDALRTRQYQTYAALSLYVDPTGNDGNACTSTGTDACLTLSGALSKVPRNVRHNVTVGVAAGTYTETFRVQGFNIEAGPGVGTQPVLTVAGTISTFSPATGSATGTVTSYTGNLATGAHAILNDTTQTWTVDDLRGRFVTVNSGPGAGENHLITSNTATALSLAFPFIASPTAASTYTIQTPGTIFTGTSASVRGISGSGGLTVQDISMQPATGTAFSVNSVGGQFTTTRVRITGPSSGVGTSATPAVGASSWSLNQVYVTAGTGSGFAVPQFARLTFTELFIYCTGTCAGVGLFNSAVSSAFNALTGTIAGSFTSMVTLNSPSNAQSFGLWLDCTNPTGNGIFISATSDTTLRTSAGWTANAGPYFDSCFNGYSLNVPGQSYIDNGNVFTNVTNAIVLSAGHRAVLEAGTTTTGVTNFLTVDGVVYTDAEITSYGFLQSPRGTYVTRP